ncbi:ATP-dependent zinc metalloprotease FtsH [Anaerohalosphaera lusitana]|uniref:ATP-dependent zinc metalloprotease FtsH n=1 Tax=Anaerohalosphaera lusitana TaxID=1936003 RepID=A0A1U9NHF7_9BACT|nr:ATP-dependent zinc metalloprotease FtsH [Anaerohalosphaera lusitana]AQT67184.1 ATP-dependent zinc metalloprotease FtsH [Anaerohalosphaera lusitana]
MDNKPNRPNKNIPPKGPGGDKQPPKMGRGPFSWIIIALIVIMVLTLVSNFQAGEKLDYSQLKDYISKGYVASVKMGQAQLTGEFSEQGLSELELTQSSFEVNNVPFMETKEFENFLEQNNVEIKGSPPDIWGPILGSMLPLLLIVGIIYFFFMRSAKSGGGMLMSFGRSRHRVQGKGQTKVTFDNVAGIEEAKEEVAETIEFLKNPKKFAKIGGRIPRGVLLVGPPGCGKTLLAKAIAGESDVPFYSISGSDFVEMFVGVGASRVRDLFKQAKDNSPCIIFLDEIDAIGRKRGATFASGGHDEREQTLNAILVEMDGFETSDQVIVIAATNRADILDPALTRPGRFDRQVVVPLPDLKGRTQILRIHAKKVKVSEDVDFERLARGTPMFSGAELEALINEAAIGASMADKDYVEMPDLEEARDKVRWGRAKRSRVVDEHDKYLTAYHEAGHAFVQASLEEADPLHKVSIIPRGPMGGATFALPEKDRLYYSRKYCHAQLQVCFGGRIAEEIFCDDITSGAASDIKQATAMAKEMILSWGMGEGLVPLDYSGNQRESFYPGATPEYSEKTAEMIDTEVKELISRSYEAAKKLLESNREKVEALAEALLKYETLDAKDVEMILEGGTLDKPTVAELLAAEQKRSEEKKAKEAEEKEAQGDPEKLFEDEKSFDDLYDEEDPYKDFDEEDEEKW